MYFYAVLLAALISAWGKIGNFHVITAAGAWVVGVLSLNVVAQYCRWQILLQASIVICQSLMASDKEPLIEECDFRAASGRQA